MGISVEAASLLSLFVESLLYGCFVVTFIGCCGIIYGRYHYSPTTRVLNIRLIVVLASMFILSTMHVATSMWRILAAFLGPGQGKTGEFLNTVTNTQYVIRITTYGVQTFIGDTFIVYRLYIVWKCNKMPCIPAAILFVGNLAAALGCVIPHDSGSPLHSPWGIAFFWITLAINLYATGLIASRLWYLHHQITSTGIPSRALTAASVIIESCAAYSASLALLIAFYMNGTNARDIMMDSMSPIMGIIFSLVIVRVALGVSSNGETLPTKHGAQLSTLVFQHNSSCHDNVEKSSGVGGHVDSFSINPDQAASNV